MRINPYKLFHGSFIPEWLMTTGIVSSNAKIIYARLCRYAGENGRCYPKLDELAAEVGMPLNTMRRALDELIEQGMVETARRGLGLPNDYFFLWHPLMGNPDCPPVGKQEIPPVGKPECPPVGTPISRESVKRVSQESTPLTPQGETTTKEKRNAARGQRFEDYLEQNEFAISDMLRWAEQNTSWEWGGPKGINAVFESFRDYWRAAPGAKGVKSDWAATWRNWCRREQERRPPQQVGNYQRPSQLAAVLGAVVVERVRQEGVDGDSADSQPF